MSPFLARASAAPLRTRLLALLLALGATSAVANDTVAETAAGGLVFRHSGDIDMVSEDLFVSADQVRVRYVFRNRASRAVETIVAFPMPDRDLSLGREGDVAFPSGFRTLVDGKTVAMAVERKAVLKGIDRTALLAGLRIPIAGDGDALGASLDRLSDRDKRRLIALGLAEAEEYDVGRGMERHLAPMWTVKESWYWRQTFPAGRSVSVEHSYAPGAGASIGTPLASPAFRSSAEGRRMIADYCIDAGFLAALDRMAKALGSEYPTLPEWRIGYVLTTGANWRAPIADFRLTVDKGSAANVVSFCGSGLRQTGPTRFEMHRRDWRPERDLEVLIVGPPSA